MNTDKIFVVKVQVPLYSNEPNPQCLVYNKDRSFETFIPVDESILNITNGRPKVYLRAAINNRRLTLDTKSEVPHPGW